MRETCVSFEVLLDPERTVYQAYQLDRSRLRSWSPRTLWLYVKLLASGRKWIPKQDESDTSQLGGDFIVDAHGILKLAYRSYDPADRPSVDNLLAILKRL